MLVADEVGLWSTEASPRRGARLSARRLVKTTPFWPGVDQRGESCPGIIHFGLGALTEGVHGRRIAVGLKEYAGQCRYYLRKGRRRRIVVEVDTH
jgi:hypothetical protein